MKAALVELSQGKSKLPIGTGAWRDAIYRVYNRKVAEQAQMFPVFHCFETAFRSRIAVSLEEHYKSPQWWGVFAERIASGGDGKDVTRVGVIEDVPNTRLRSIRLMVSDMMDKSIDVSSYQDGYGLLENSTMGQIHRLLFREYFKIGLLYIKKDDILDKFEIVRSARNSVYHHQSFSGMRAATETAAELLDYIGFSLPKVHKLIATSTCAQPHYF
jgi:hypothetical protein